MARSYGFRLLATICCASAFFLFQPKPSEANQSVKQKISGGLPASANAAKVKSSFDGPLPTMTLVLSPGDPDGLDRYLSELQNPASPNFHKWLTPDEFGARFGRSEAEVRRVTEWLESNGLHVARAWPNRLQITFDGAPTAVEQAFSVKLGEYRMDHETAFAPDSAPSVPEELSEIVRGVAGMHGFTRFQPTVSEFSPAPQTFFALKPADLATVYNLGPLFETGLDGSGVDVAIVGRSDFNLSDVTAFRSRFTLPEKIPEKLFPFGARPNRGGADEAEVVLNCEWVGAAAPDATIRTVLAQEIDLALQATVNGLPESKVINVSYALCERVVSAAELDLVGQVFAQAAAQGQTVFVASGNDGVSLCRAVAGSPEPAVNFLAASPNVTGVGGTNLDPNFDANGNATRYGGETAWAGSGGGDSVFVPLPDFQREAGITGAGRAIPDVSLLSGSPGYLFVLRGSPFIAAGTSFAAPCWSGLCAVLNEAKQTRGLGNINPELYRLGTAQRKGGTKVFFDVTSGGNSRDDVRGFDAGPGYDKVTGWGSYDAAALVRSFAVTAPPDKQPPTVKLLSPTNIDRIGSDQTVAIRWESSDDVGIVRHDLLLSRDNGKTFVEAIASGLPGDARSFDWKPATKLFPTIQARIAVRATDAAFNSTTDLNGETFRITDDVTPPEIHIDEPVADAKILAGADVGFPLQWTMRDDVGLVSSDVFLSRDGGETFDSPIVTGLPVSNQETRSMGFFFWRPPASVGATDKARIAVRVRDTSGNTAEARSAPFTILSEARPPQVRLTQPTTAGTLERGTILNVTWEVVPTDFGVDREELLLSLDSGRSFQRLETITLSRDDSVRERTRIRPVRIDGLLPATTGARFEIRVTDAVGGKNTISTGDFTIPPTEAQVTVTTPRADDALVADVPTEIAWSVSGQLEKITGFNAELLVRTDLLSFSSPVRTQIQPEARTSLVTPPRFFLAGNSSARVRMRINALAGESIIASGESEEFTLLPPRQTLVVQVGTPEPATEFFVGDPLRIIWTTTPIPIPPQSVTQDVALSSDDGETYPRTIATGLSGGASAFIWDIPADFPPTEFARVRVTATRITGERGVGQSQGPFRIRARP